MVPYVAETTMSQHGRILPAAFQESGKEIRTFMPRWGMINERRNQLHEVIRLSGMNIIIDDTDHPLIIKVASIQAARMQVYFIDNDDYFHKRLMMCDDQGQPYADNIERAVFYARGVLETVKKLRWTPDVIFCQGWMAAIAPLYIKTAYKDEPTFASTKVVSSFYKDLPEVNDAAKALELITFRSADSNAIADRQIDLHTPDALGRIALAFSDAVIEGEPEAQPQLLAQAEAEGKPVLRYSEEGELTDRYTAFIKLI